MPSNYSNDYSWDLNPATGNPASSSASSNFYGTLLGSGSRPTNTLLPSTNPSSSAGSNSGRPDYTAGLDFLQATRNPSLAGFGDTLLGNAKANATDFGQQVSDLKNQVGGLGTQLATTRAALDLQPFRDQTQAAIKSLGDSIAKSAQTVGDLTTQYNSRSLLGGNLGGSSYANRMASANYAKNILPYAQLVPQAEIQASLDYARLLPQYAAQQAAITKDQAGLATLPLDQGMRVGAYNTGQYGQLVSTDTANKMQGVGGFNATNRGNTNPFLGSRPDVQTPTQTPFTPPTSQTDTVNQGLLSKNNLGMVKSQFDPYPGAVSDYLKQKGVLPWQDPNYNPDLFSSLISNNGEQYNNQTIDLSQQGYYGADGAWNFYPPGASGAYTQDAYIGD
jgi:hypothetical protein